MRLARLGTVSGIFFSIALLAACGGGGGGGNVNPPAGGNGGGGPTATPTPVTSGAPTPTATPTAVATATPTATPTPIPTATPTPTASPSSAPLAVTIQVGNGTINGVDDWLKTSASDPHQPAGMPAEGDLMPNDAGATPQGGGQGPVNAGLVDNIPCESTMPTNYHVHAFVGIIYNGQEYTLPDAVGIVDPYGEFPAGTAGTDGYPNQEIYGDCFYHMHTHDASGEVHMEAPSPTCGYASNWTTPCNMSNYTLGNLMDIWGAQLTPANLATLAGPVSVYTSPLQYAPCNVTSPNSSGCYTSAKTYSLYTGDPMQIPLFSHTVVWIVIGAQPASPSSLPNIEWYSGS